MAGNAREWTQDCWHENYQNAPKSRLGLGKQAPPVQGICHSSTIEIIGNRRGWKESSMSHYKEKRPRNQNIGNHRTVVEANYYCLTEVPAPVIG
jgi:hypothetical protein